MIRRTFLALAPLAVLALAGCNNPSSSSSSPSGSASTTAAKTEGKSLMLNGAGATFPYPLYSKWVSDYQAAAPSVRVNYQSVGSGAGIRQISEKTVDFGASDAPMTDEQLGKAPAKLVHVPTTLGAVAVTYNLAGVDSLELTPEVLSGVFLGDIKKWDDPKIKALNPNAKLPAQAISVVHRSDGSGTTAVFTEYLSKVSEPWKTKVGSNTSVSWPAGIGAKGNEGVSGQIKTTPGTLGYVELAYALQNKFPVAKLQNKAGKMIAPSIAGIQAAAKGADMPDDMRLSITNPAGEEAYPIASYTYVLVYEDAADAQKGEALAKFLWWATHDGQKACEPLHYAPLPTEVVTKVEAKLKTLKAGGKPIQY